MLTIAPAADRTGRFFVRPPVASLQIVIWLVRG